MAVLRQQTYIPMAHRTAYLAAQHDRMGHAGQTRCPHGLQQHAYWPSMRRDVRRYIRRCPTCAMVHLDRVKAGRAYSLHNGDHPGDIWTFDITEIKIDGSSMSYLLVFIDRFSRWADAVPFDRDPSSAEVIEAFVSHIVKVHGFPRAMQCDRGTNLMQGEAPDWSTQGPQGRGRSRGRACS